MQVLFGADEMLGAAGMLRQAARAGKKGLKLGAKGIRAASNIAPAVALIPGVGLPAAAALTAGKQALDLGAKGRKVARPLVKPAVSMAAKSMYTQKPKTVIPAPKSILDAMKKKTFLPSGKPPFIPGLPPLPSIPGVPSPGGGGKTPAPVAETPKEDFLKKNWALLAGGAVILFLIAGKRR